MQYPRFHEGVHAIAQARGIKDTSRQGRYHNARFRALAHEAGLEPEPRDPVIGFSRTTLSATAAQEYETALGGLSAALAGHVGPQDRAAAAAARGPVCECGSWAPMTRCRIEPVAGTVMCRTCGAEP